jgi:hypothetical protein
MNEVYAVAICGLLDQQLRLADGELWCSNVWFIFKLIMSSLNYRPWVG